MTKVIPVFVVYLSGADSVGGAGAPLGLPPKGGALPRLPQGNGSIPYGAPEGYSHKYLLAGGD